MRAGRRPATTAARWPDSGPSPCALQPERNRVARIERRDPPAGPAPPHLAPPGLPALAREDLAAAGAAEASVARPGAGAHVERAGDDPHRRDAPGRRDVAAVHPGGRPLGEVDLVEVAAPRARHDDVARADEPDRAVARPGAR